jgi:hypothetical protein
MRDARSGVPGRRAAHRAHPPVQVTLQASSGDALVPPGRRAAPGAHDPPVQVARSTRLREGGWANGVKVRRWTLQAKATSLATKTALKPW